MLFERAVAGAEGGEAVAVFAAWMVSRVTGMARQIDAAALAALSDLRKAKYAPAPTAHERNELTRKVLALLRRTLDLADSARGCAAGMRPRWKEYFHATMPSRSKRRTMGMGLMAKARRCMALTITEAGNRVDAGGWVERR